MAENAKTPESSDGKSRIRFHYLKSTQYRVIHVDGAIGSLTPTGYLHMSLFNERPAIPREMVHKLNDDGSLGDVIPEETIAKEGIIREMEVDVLMSIATANSLKVLLEQKIKEFETQLNVVIK